MKQLKRVKRLQGNCMRNKEQQPTRAEATVIDHHLRQRHMSFQITFTSIYTVKRREEEDRMRDLQMTLNVVLYLLCLCCQADGREREVRWLSEVRERCV